MNKPLVIIMSVIFFVTLVFLSYEMGRKNERAVIEVNQSEQALQEELKQSNIYACDDDHQLSVSNDGTGIAVTIMYKNGEYGKAFFANSLRAEEGNLVEYSDEENVFLIEDGVASFAINEVNVVENCVR